MSVVSSANLEQSVDLDDRLISHAALIYVRICFTRFHLKDEHIAEFVDDLIKSLGRPSMCYEYTKGPVEDFFRLSREHHSEAVEIVSDTLKALSKEIWNWADYRQKTIEALTDLNRHHRMAEIRRQGLDTEVQVMRDELRKARNDTLLAVQDVREHVEELFGALSNDPPPKRLRTQ